MQKQNKSNQNLKILLLYLWLILPLLMYPIPASLLCSTIASTMTIFSPYLPFILSISLSLSFSFFFSFILPSLHLHHHLLLRSFLGFSGGLGLLTAIALVIVKKPPSPVKTHTPLHDIRRLVVDGLTSCTESLGFESSDESRLMDHLENRPDCWTDTATATQLGHGICTRTTHRVRKEVRSFPPPLSSLNLNGQPSFFLRPVRKDGRLELTEVRIHRPEILHVWRHDGRLTLHLIPDESSLDDLVEDDVEEEEQQQREEEEEIMKTITDEEQEEEIVKATADEEEEFRFGDWKIGNEGLRRCHQVVNDHGSHHHHLHNHPLHMHGVGIA